MADTGILTYLLIIFTEKATFGYAQLQGDALTLMSKLFILDIVITGVMWACGIGHIAVDSLKKLTAIGFYVYLILNMHTVSRAIILSFGKYGLNASGNAITINDLLNPSAIIDFGFTCVKPLFGSLGGWTIFTKPVSNVFAGLSSIFILAAFFAIGINLFLVIVEFYVFSMCSIIMIPFAIFRPLAYLAERSIGGLFVMGIRLMVLAFIISVTYHLLQSLALPDNPTYRQLFSTFLCAGTIAFLSINLPNSVGSILGGNPSLTSKGLFGFASTSATMAVGATILQSKVRNEGFKAVKFASSKINGGFQRFRA